MPKRPPEAFLNTWYKSIIFFESVCIEYRYILTLLFKTENVITWS